ncbi:MAG TPA: DUF47 family protein [bacterium]|nr:DUF47 family protein [bacterium]
MKFNILDLLLPRETKFYDHFEEQADILIKAALVFHDLMTHLEKMPEHEIKQKIGEIKELETKGDTVEHKIIDDLSQTFITPFDREDIHAMAVNIDRALDILNSSVNKIDMYNIRKTPAHVIHFADIIVDMCKELRTLMGLFRAKGNVDETVAKIHQYENKADYLFHISMADLFNNNTNAVEIIKFKEVYEHLENLTDCVDYIAKTIRGIIVKLG